MSKESLIKLRDHLLETLSYAERVWLVDELKQVDDEVEMGCPYTKEELDARIEQAEREIANGECISSEEFFRNLDQRFNLGWYQPERMAV